MVVVRIVALLLLVVALMLLGADIVSTLELGGQFVTRSLDSVVLLIGGTSANESIEATFPVQVASILITIFNLPGWLSTGLLGVLLAFASARGKSRPA